MHLTLEQALEILGLGPDATSEDIKQAYRDLVKVWHPDRFSDGSRVRRKAEEKLKEINAAYDLLQGYDPALRARSTPAGGTSPSPNPAQDHHRAEAPKQDSPPPPPRPFGASSKKAPAPSAPAPRWLVRPTIIWVASFCVITLAVMVILVSKLMEPSKTANSTSNPFDAITDEPVKLTESPKTRLLSDEEVGIAPNLVSKLNDPTKTANSMHVNPKPGLLTWIEPGTFTMGSPPTEKDRLAEEGPQTQVTISRGFWMSKYEVTQEEYLAVMGKNLSKFTGDLKRAVEQVSWYDAMNYCFILTAREKTAGRLPAGYVYRLPTEAEWEYACRAGTTTATAFGNSLSATQANFDGSYLYPYNRADKGRNLGRTTAVGSYAPNAWGLYDMHGNVWEWCLDWYGSYPGGSVTDPKGAKGSVSGKGRVSRGGGWSSSGWCCRSAVRNSGWPDYRFDYFGFRPVLAPSQ